MKCDINENKTVQVLNFGKKAKEKYNDRFAKCAENFGLKESEGHILVFLYMNKEYNIASDIVNNRGFSKAYVSKCLATLKDKGLVTTNGPLEDKRFQQINITSKGLEVCKSFAKAHKDIVECATKGITKEDMNIFFNVLKKVYENLEGNEEDV